VWSRCCKSKQNEFLLGLVKQYRIITLLVSNLQKTFLSCFSPFHLCTTPLTEFLEPAKSRIVCRRSSFQNTTSSRKDLTVFEGWWKFDERLSFMFDVHVRIVLFGRKTKDKMQLSSCNYASFWAGLLKARLS